MSSDNQNNIISFPGTAKSNARVSKKDENKQSHLNNVIQIPLKTVESPSYQTMEKKNMMLQSSNVQRSSGVKNSNNNIINKTNSDFWRERGHTTDFHSSDKDEAEAGSFSASGGGGESSGGGGESSGGGGESLSGKKFHYVGVACALCFMLVSVPFLNQKNARGLASSLKSALPVKIIKPDGTQYKVDLYENENGALKLNLLEEGNLSDRNPSSVEKDSFLGTFKSVFGFSNRDPDNEDKEKIKTKWRVQQDKALYLINKGQRKLAGIGRDPQARDIFSIEELNSSYNVKWRRGKLVYAILLPGKSPVLLPTTEHIVRRYREIFPAHRVIRKLDSLSGDLEIYELRNAEGLITAQVETLRDEKGRVLSIHVQ